jgi:hypothetical protein
MSIILAGKQALSLSALHLWIALCSLEPLSSPICSVGQKLTPRSSAWVWRLALEAMVAVDIDLG